MKEGKKQFKCDICNASFGENGNLNRHVSTIHEGKKQFKCDICSVNFGEKRTLNLMPMPSARPKYFLASQNWLSKKI